jgi:CheY-like chemotaxis protein
MVAPSLDAVVLVVEDETAVRSFCCTVLQRHGFSIVDAATPAAAIELAKTRHQVSVVLTDMTMPGMNGTELVKRLQAIAPGIKAVYMSGYSEGRLVDSRELGPGVELLQKPFTSAELLRRVRAVLALP